MTRPDGSFEMWILAIGKLHFEVKGNPKGIFLRTKYHNRRICQMSLEISSGVHINRLIIEPKKRSTLSRLGVRGSGWNLWVAPHLKPLPRRGEENFLMDRCPPAAAALLNPIFIIGTNGGVKYALALRGDIL